MKGISFVFQAFFLWQRSLVWSTRLGLLLLLLALPARFIDPRMSYGLAMWGGFAALVLPYLLAPMAFRGLISNTRLSLLPHFHVGAGLALLLLTLLVAAWLPLAALYAGVPQNPLWFPRLFVAASLYAGLMQLILPSRYQVAIFSTLPFVILLLLTRFGELLESVVQTPSLTLLAIALCAAAWAWGLFVLRRRNVFQPVYQTQGKDDWLYMDFGWSNRRGLGKVRTPAGTLLLGYPDGLGSRLLRILNFTLVSPLVCVLFLYLIGPAGERSDNPVFADIGLSFLAFCLFSSLLFTWNYGEMAARCRLLWLRLGKARGEQWALLEHHILLNLILLYAVAGLTLLVVGLVSPFAPVIGLHFMAILVSRSLFDVYFNLMGRVKGWAGPVYGFLGLLTAAAMFIGIVIAVQNRNPLLMVAVEALQIALAALFRYVALREFRHIDWRLVMLKARPRERAAS